MKLTIERAQLLKALHHVQNVVERRGTIPILSNVKLDARTGADGGLLLTATDMDISSVEQIVADVAISGATTVPAHVFYEIVRKLPDGCQVEMEQSEEDALVTIRAGRSRFSLPVMAADGFPPLADGDLPHSFTIAASELKTLIDRTRFAISTEETRYYLNGIYMHVGTSDHGPVLRAAATDGHRLARAEVTLPEGAESMPGVIVPRKAVAEIYRLLDEGDGVVSLALSEARFRVSMGNLSLTTKLIDGTFPDYERVIPENNDKLLTVDTKILRAAVDRVSSISNEKGRGIKVSMADNVVTLSASAQEGGGAVDEVEGSYAAEPMDIGFNARYLIEILDQLQGDTATFLLDTAASPTVVRDSTAAVTYVLMPMRV